MSKALHYYVLFIVLAVLSLSLGLSSLLLWVVFPRGYHPSRQLWVDIHNWGGLALSLLVLLHVSLHWGWLIRMTKRYLVLRRALRRQVETANRQPDAIHVIRNPFLSMQSQAAALLPGQHVEQYQGRALSHRGAGTQSARCVNLIPQWPAAGCAKLLSEELAI